MRRWRSLQPRRTAASIEFVETTIYWGFPAMPPVNTSAPVTDVDNEITAELPVLDVAAYEATLGDPGAHTDSWSVPAEALASPASDVTAVMPAVSAPKHDIDHSGTHEM